MTKCRLWYVWIDGGAVRVETSPPLPGRDPLHSLKRIRTLTARAAARRYIRGGTMDHFLIIHEDGGNDPGAERATGRVRRLRGLYRRFMRGSALGPPGSVAVRLPGKP